MNILYLNRGMGIGGVEKCILQLSKLFKIEGNKIIVVSMGGKLVKELEGINIKHYNIINTDSKNPINIFKNILNIYGIIKKENIEIIHSHHRMTTLLAKIISKFINVKIIHTQHLCIEDKYKLTKLALKNIQIITVSNAAKRILIKKVNLKADNITTIYNTIETECNNKVVDEKILKLKEQGDFIVAQISRLVDYKGVYDFLEIAKVTNSQNKKIKFVLIGDGPEKNNLRNYIENQKLQDVVYILGSKDNVIEHLKYIDLLLLCSYIEGLPLSPLEAFSQGVPVIATDIDGTNEEIINDKNGYLIEKCRIYDFKTSIIELFNNKEKYGRMKSECKKIYCDKFNKNRYYEQHLNLYLKLGRNK